MTESMMRTVADKLMNDLALIEDKDYPFFVMGDKSFSVNQLIEEIRNFTPLGKDLIVLDYSLDEK